jgi:hypothetical protein
MSDLKALSTLADKVLNDPILLRKLGDRIYEIMQEDIRNQRDRTGYFKRSLP